MICQAVSDVLENFRSYKSYVGFSGGADSVSLLVAANELAEEFDLDINAVHFEHGIRGEASLRDAQWCREFCRQRQIKYEQYDLHILDERRKSKNKENIEAVARRLRIAKWNELLGNQKECAVLLGHHADDRIENMFIRLCRGANVSGLSSMREESMIKNVKFIRPLLAYGKSDLIEFLAERGIAEWCVDHSNFDENYTRNYFRHRIIPEIIQQLPTAATGLIKAAKALEIDARFIEEMAHAKYSLIASQQITRLKFWRTLAPALRARILRYWLSDLLKVEFIPNYDLLERFQTALEQKSNHQLLVPLTNGNFIWMHRGELGLTLANATEAGLDENVWNWQQLNTIRYGDKIFRITIEELFEPEKINSENAAFDADLLPAKLILSQRKTGDKMIPFGGNNPVKVKKILTGHKLTTTEKDNLPVLRIDDNTIIWLPGVRHSNFAPVSEKTTRVAIIKISSKETE
jgi:tRNA(Ile)-lysidine synthase